MKITIKRLNTFNKLIRRSLMLSGVRVGVMNSCLDRIERAIESGWLEGQDLDYILECAPVIIKTITNSPGTLRGTKIAAWALMRMVESNCFEINQSFENLPRNYRAE